MGRQDFSRWQDDDSGWDEEPGNQDGRAPIPFPGSPEGRRSDEHVLRDILESLAEN